MDRRTEVGFVIPDLDQHLAGIVAGESQAFALWLAGAELPLRRSLRSFAKDVDSEAVVQEALLRVWQVAPRVEPDGKPNGLLRLAVTIARRLALSEVRRTRYAPEPLTEPDENALEGLDGGRSGSDPFLRSAIERCREKLSRKLAQAIAARLDARGARSDRELAEKLGLKLNTFLQHVTRARRALAECLTRAGIDVTEELS